MTRHPWKRLLAWIVDWLIILVWVAVVAAVGVPLYLTGITIAMPVLWLNVVATVTLVVPITVLLAGLEASAKEASLGKRLARLRVVSLRAGDRLSFGRAMVRNSLKIAVPWVIGHAAVYGIVSTSGSAIVVPMWIWVVTGLAYVLPVTYLVSLFVGTGRTPYDRLSGAAVVAASAKSLE